MTRRERLEARAERRRAWAESREAKSDAAYSGAREIADGIPFGQPILVGHHSEGRARRDQARIERGMAAAVENDRAAADHRSAADGIDRQLATSVFSDDEDAPDRLRERIAALEAQRDRIKAYNASCRKGARNVELLDEAQREDILSIAQHAAYQLGRHGEFPSYALSNLGGRIRDQKKRLERIERDREQAANGQRGAGRAMLSRYAGSCPDCGGDIARGDAILWYRVTREAVHQTCPAAS